MTAQILRLPRFLLRRHWGAPPPAKRQVVDMRETFAREQRANGWVETALALDEIVTAIRFAIDMGDADGAAAAIREMMAYNMPSDFRTKQRDSAALTLAAALHGREQSEKTRALFFEIDARLAAETRT